MTMTKSDNALKEATINGIILAGGLSSRFGMCKSLIELDKQSLLKITFELLSEYCKKVLVSCREEKKIADYPCLYDNEVCYAPISGIYTALEYFQTPVIVLSCDLPFMDRETIQKLIDARNTAVQEQENLLMTTFRHEGTDFIEALVSIYEVSAMPLLRKALDEKKYALWKVIPEENRKHITTSHIVPFFNINYQQDLEKAKEIKVLQKTLNTKVLLNSSAKKKKRWG